MTPVNAFASRVIALSKAGQRLLIQAPGEDDAAESHIVAAQQLLREIEVLARAAVAQEVSASRREKSDA